MTAIKAGMPMNLVFRKVCTCVGRSRSAQLRVVPKMTGRRGSPDHRENQVLETASQALASFVD